MKELIHFGSLQLEIGQDSGSTVFTLQGDVDETFDQTLIPTPSTPVLVLNLAQINHFNSIGIREWIHFIRRMSSAETLIFRECAVAVIDQINMVPDSLGNGQVESFFAPYYCACGKESNCLIHVHDHANDLRQMEAPTFKCECGQDLEFDAIEESYFQFFHHLPKVG